MADAGHRLPTGGVKVRERSGQIALSPCCTVLSPKLAQDLDDLLLGKNGLGQTAVVGRMIGHGFRGFSVFAAERHNGAWSNSVSCSRSVPGSLDSGRGPSCLPSPGSAAGKRIVTRHLGEYSENPPPGVPRFPESVRSLAGGHGIEQPGPPGRRIVDVRMKSTLLLAVICAGMACLPLRGQTVIVAGAAGYAAAPAPVCQAGACPLVVAAPLVYQAPTVPCGNAAPNVIYVGAGCGYPRPNYYSGCGYSAGYGGWGYAAPNVIPFGAGQAYVQGYYFRHCR
jgi:hypothetical protein